VGLLEIGGNLLKSANRVQRAKEVEMITAKVQLTQLRSERRQFVATTGSNHHLLLDDAEGASGPKPIELVAVALAGCTAFDVITILRQKHHQHVTEYEVRVEADQAASPPQIFTAVRIHHVVTGCGIDPTIVEQAIRLSEDKYCSVGAMIERSAVLDTTFEISEENSSRIDQEPAAVTT
jgi:putative redox protein